MYPSDALVCDLEDDGEESGEPQVATQLCHQSYSAYVCNIHWALLKSLVRRESSEHPEDRIATDEDAQECHIYHHSKWLLTRAVTGNESHEEVRGHPNDFNEGERFTGEFELKIISNQKKLIEECTYIICHVNSCEVVLNGIGGEGQGQEDYEVKKVWILKNVNRYTDYLTRLNRYFLFFLFLLFVKVYLLVLYFFRDEEKNINSDHELGGAPIVNKSGYCYQWLLPWSTGWEYPLVAEFNGIQRDEDSG